jgi:hypothetical protein
MGVTPIGDTQRDIFATMTNQHLATGAYAPDTKQYIVSICTGNSDRNNITFAFGLNAIAKWDVGFDVISRRRDAENDSVLIAARNGYIHELGSGNDDGASVNGVNGTLTGTITGGGTDTIVDSTATFTTTGDGLSGVGVYGRTSGTAAWQRRTIVSNTATTLYLDSAFTGTAAGTYVVAPIDWYWESRWMDMGDMSIVKRLRFIQFWLDISGASSGIIVKWKSDVESDWQSQTLTTSDDFAKLITNTRGRKIKFRFESVMPNQPVTIEAFQSVFDPKRFV